MIPKITHQVWVGKTPIPERYLAWREGLIALNPGWEHRLHRFPGREGIPDRFLSNLARVEILRDFGGLYLDMDVESVQAIPVSWLSDDRILRCEWVKHGPHLGVMSARSGANAVQCLADIFTQKVKDWKVRPWPPFTYALRLYRTKHRDEIGELRGTSTAPDGVEADTVLYHHLLKSLETRNVRND
jgi:hypothetical protein